MLLYRFPRTLTRCEQIAPIEAILHHFITISNAMFEDPQYLPAFPLFIDVVSRTINTVQKKMGFDANLRAEAMSAANAILLSGKGKMDEAIRYAFCFLSGSIRRDLMPGRGPVPTTSCAPR